MFIYIHDILIELYSNCHNKALKLKYNQSLFSLTLRLVRGKRLWKFGFFFSSLVNIFPKIYSKCHKILNFSAINLLNLIYFIFLLLIKTHILLATTLLNCTMPPLKFLLSILEKNLRQKFLEMKNTTFHAETD